MHAPTLVRMGMRARTPEYVRRREGFIVDDVEDDDEDEEVRRHERRKRRREDRERDLELDEEDLEVIGVQDADDGAVNFSLLSSPVAVLTSLV